MPKRPDAFFFYECQYELPPFGGFHQTVDFIFHKIQVRRIQIDSICFKIIGFAPPLYEV